MKDRNRHPLPHDDQIRPTIAIDVLPHGIGHHADVREARRCFVGDVRELSSAIVSQQNALRIDAVASWNTPSADEKIDRAISVKIRGGDAGPAQRQWWQRSDRLSEVALPIIQV